MLQSASGASGQLEFSHVGDPQSLILAPTTLGSWVPSGSAACQARFPLLIHVLPPSSAHHRALTPDPTYISPLLAKVPPPLEAGDRAPGALATPSLGLPAVGGPESLASVSADSFLLASPGRGTSVTSPPPRAHGLPLHHEGVSRMCPASCGLHPLCPRVTN